MSPIHTPGLKRDSDSGSSRSTGNRKLLYLFGIAGGLFACLLGALSVKFYVAFSSHEGVMTDDYYDVGRNFDEYRARMRNAPNRQLDSALLRRADGGLQTGSNRMAVRYRHRERGPIARAKITLRLNRRSTLKGAMEAECRTDERGACLLEFTLPQGGYYEMRLTALENHPATHKATRAAARFALQRSLRVSERRFASKPQDPRDSQGTSTL